MVSEKLTPLSTMLFVARIVVLCNMQLALWDRGKRFAAMCSILASSVLP
jgi:hypothetical protein